MCHVLSNKIHDIFVDFPKFRHDGSTHLRAEIQVVPGSLCMLPESCADAPADCSDHVRRREETGGMLGCSTMNSESLLYGMSMFFNCYDS